MTFQILILYAFVYLIGSQGSRLINRAVGRPVVRNVQLVGFLLLLVAVVVVGAFVRSMAPETASDFVVGQVVGEIAIGPGVVVAAAVAVAAWLRNRRSR